MFILLVCLLEKKGFQLTFESLSVMMADGSKLLVRHTKTNVLRTSDACSAVRNVDYWWSADEDAK